MNIYIYIYVKMHMNIYIYICIVTSIDAAYAYVHVHTHCGRNSKRDRDVLMRDLNQNPLLFLERGRFDPASFCGKKTGTERETDICQ